MNKQINIHPTAHVQSQNIGNGTNIWQFVSILPDAQIGNEANIGAHCFIENEVQIGNRVTIQSGVSIWDGTDIEDDVFIGPNVTFIHEQFPRSKNCPKEVLKTKIEAGAFIEGGAIISPGLIIGRSAVISAGAVVTTSVPPYAIVTGSPAKIIGYVDSTLSGSASEKNLITPLTPNNSPMWIGVSKVQLHYLKTVHDIRGDLSVGEFSKEIPFIPKRYFLVFNVPSKETRGEHAHYYCHQFLICIKGRCAVVVDDSKTRKEVVLDAPNLGLHIPPLIWGIQYKYSNDAVLLVFASEYYDSNEYIRNYNDFLALVHKEECLDEMEQI